MPKPDWRFFENKEKARAQLASLAVFLVGREKLVTCPLRLLGLGVNNLREPTTRRMALLLNEAEWMKLRCFVGMTSRAVINAANQTGILHWLIGF